MARIENGPWEGWERVDILPEGCFVALRPSGDGAVNMMLSKKTAETLADSYAARNDAFVWYLSPQLVEAIAEAGGH